MEFIRGVKLASLPRAEIRALVDVGQTAFLVQLLDVGYLHADPHPGNLMKVTPAGEALSRLPAVVWPFGPVGTRSVGYRNQPCSLQ